MADGEELEAVKVGQKLESQKFALYKDLEGYCSLWDTSYIPSKKQATNKQQKGKGLEELPQKYNLSPGYLNRQLHTARTSLAREIKKESDGQKSKWKFFETLNYMKEDVVKNAPLLSPGNPLSHVNFSILVSRPFLVFIERKAQTESGKLSLPMKKELISRHVCLHKTDQSHAQDSANLQHYILLRDKLVTHAVIRATLGFNLQCNNVARQVEGKCCPYYRTLTHMQSSQPNIKAKHSK